MQSGTKWQLSCGNAFVDGAIISDFDSDTEAAAALKWAIFELESRRGKA